MNKEKCIANNQGLVIKLARRYLNKRVDFLDLVQAGNLGLLDAFEHYSEAKSNGASFFTYAFYWVKKRIKEEVVNSHLIRIPSNVQGTRNRIAAAKAEYSTLFGDQPDETELADMLDTTEDEILKTNFRCDVNYFSDLNNTAAPEREELISSKQKLSKLIKNMPEKEMFVLLNRQEGDTLDVIGKKLGGLTRERVRQLEKKGLERLQRRVRRVS